MLSAYLSCLNTSFSIFTILFAPGSNFSARDTDVVTRSVYNDRC